MRLSKFFLQKTYCILAMLGWISCGPDFETYSYSNIFDYPLDPTSEYLIVIGDVQEYTYFDKYAPYYMKSVNWIRGMHQKGYKIDCVLQVGDQSSSNEKWQYRVFYDYSKYLAEDVLFVPVTGNHDYDWKDGNQIYDRSSSLFNQYTNFPKTKENIVAYFETGRMDNIIVRNQIKGQDFYIIALEFAPRPEVVDWARNYVENNQEKRFIVLTHEYLNSEGFRENTKNSYARKHFGDRPNSSPEEIWENLVYPNDNVRAVICGHNSFSLFTTSKNCEGREIPQMLFNIQYLENGGDGLIQLWEIPATGDSIDIKIINTIKNKQIDQNYHKPMCDNEIISYKISIF